MTQYNKDKHRIPPLLKVLYFLNKKVVFLETITKVKHEAI